jgi:hypothetical protein
MAIGLRVLIGFFTFWALVRLIQSGRLPAGIREARLPLGNLAPLAYKIPNAIYMFLALVTVNIAPVTDALILVLAACALSAEAIKASYARELLRQGQSRSVSSD